MTCTKIWRAKLDVDELINKTKSNSCENEYWLQLEKEILEFFKECSGEEKIYFSQ